MITAKKSLSKKLFFDAGACLLGGILGGVLYCALQKNWTLHSFFQVAPFSFMVCIIIITSKRKK
jgi:hypothetical protein